MNVSEFLSMTAAVVPERTALVCGDETRTFAELEARAASLAGALEGLGIRPGQSVATVALNSIRQVELFYACARLGAGFVPLGYRSRAEELAQLFADSAPALVFADQRYLPVVGEALASVRSDVRIMCFDSDYESLLAQPSGVPMAADDDDGAAMLLYTSGTTGRPKGVTLTHLGLTLYVANTTEPANPETQETLLLSVPLSHVAGATTLVSAVWGGRTLVILPQFSADAWLDAVERQRVTHSFIVPTMLKRIMDEPSFASRDLGSLRLLAYGAAPMPHEVISRAVEAFRCGLMNAYGQTESTSTLTYLGPEDHAIPDGPPDERERRLRRLRSVGRPMEDVEVAAVGPDRRPLPSGQEGEVVARGPRLAQTAPDGWLHTGDLGYLDEDGYLYLTGRLRDLIIRGGENISPGEIETVLEQHPAVAEAAVIGVPDAEWGEEVAVVIVPAAGDTPDMEDLTAFVKARLASHKAPKRYYFVSELPRNELGKLLKAELRRRYAEPPAD